jgi:hypothetical protein
MKDLAEAIDMLNDLEGKIDDAIRVLVEAGLENPFDRLAGQSDRDIDKITDLIEGVKIQIEALMN